MDINVANLVIYVKIYLQLLYLTKKPVFAHSALTEMFLCYLIVDLPRLYQPITAATLKVFILLVTCLLLEEGIQSASR